jgi:hypothetical protein
MSTIDSLLPHLVAGKILSVAELNAVYTTPGIVGRDYDSDFIAAGQSITIGSVGPTSIIDYDDDTTLTYGDVNIGTVTLVVDQQKAFTFSKDDIKAKQCAGDYVTVKMKDAAYQVSQVREQKVASLYSEAGISGSTYGLGTTSTPLEINSSNFVDLLAVLQAALLEKNPLQPFWVALHPQVALKMNIAGLETIRASSVNEKIAGAGFLGSLMGFDIYVSANCSKASSTPTAGKYKIMAGVQGAIQFVDNLERIEELRDKDRFGDLYRGLYVYGVKTIVPNQLACAVVNAAAEA